jgi:hypothetical protein
VAETAVTEMVRLCRSIVHLADAWQLSQTTSTRVVKSPGADWLRSTMTGSGRVAPVGTPRTIASLRGRSQEPGSNTKRKSSGSGQSALCAESESGYV